MDRLTEGTMDTERNTVTKLCDYREDLKALLAKQYQHGYIDGLEHGKAYGRDNILLIAVCAMVFGAVVGTFL